MPLVSSEYKDFPQVDGTRHVHVYHIDDKGKWHRAERSHDVPAGRDIDAELPAMRAAYQKKLYAQPAEKVAGLLDAKDSPERQLVDINNELGLG